MSIWPDSGIPRIDPLEGKSMSVRPKISRRKENNEGKWRNVKLTKSETIMSCEICGEVDHNKYDSLVR